MRKTTWLLSLVILALQAAIGYAQTTSSNLLQCRRCLRASDLSDCNKLVTCDGTLEDCYMDEIVTDQLTVVYNAGCRAKDVCALGSSGSASVGRKRDSVACSRCCNFGHDCNRRLCGIKDGTLNNSQCYSCDHRRHDGQFEVSDPTKCVTLTTCQRNQMCYATQSDIAGRDTFYYGCQSKILCHFLMEKAFEDYKVCELNATSPPNGLTWSQVCGNIGQLRSTSLCHSCCADGGCNYGTCASLNERIFKLAVQGKFDMKTLKAI